MIDEEDDLQIELQRASDGISISVLILVIIQSLATYLLMVKLEYFWNLINSQV